MTTPALALADADGKVLSKLHRIGTLSDDLVDHWLRKGLSAAGMRSTARKVEDLYRDGELERLLALTRSASKVDERIWRAKALVRLGELERAAEALGSLQSGPALGVQAWMDKFLLGRAYGTAMALLILEE